jgi:hypothetical protein
MGLLILFIIGIGIYFYIDRNLFYKSNYNKESGVTYAQTRFNSGYYGEYLTFKYLESLKGHHKILANIYVPKGDDGQTTEVDLILVHEKGIYVLESKNYGGWIYGNEKSTYWTQTFKTGKKEKFYNPIFQNNTHLKHLKNVLYNIDPKIFKSIIVFSERCTLKKIDLSSSDVQVIKRNNLQQTLNRLIHNSEIVLSKDRVDEIYRSLKIYTLVKDDVKRKHIENINSYKTRM